MTNVGQQLVSGTLSGLATTVFLQPFDLLKTRVQQNNGPSVPRHIIIETAKNVLSTDGLKGLWRGTGASLVRNVPGVAIYMTGLTQLRALMASSPYFVDNRRTVEVSSVLPTLTNQGNLLAGASARVAVGFVLNPFSVLKARYECNTYPYNSLIPAFISIIRQGPSEIFRGLVASSIRDAPYAGLFMIFYETMKHDASSIIVALDNKPSIVHLFSAASAGAIATAITHPFDVIKTKMQTRVESPYNKLNTTIKCIWKVSFLAKQGFLEFDVGNERTEELLDSLVDCHSECHAKVVSSAIVWTIYEGFLIFMNTRLVQREQ
jgi:solute carrier family 25 protein 38